AREPAAQGTAADGGTRDGCDLHGWRHLAGVFHRHRLVGQRAHDRHAAAQVRRSGFHHAGVRARAHAAADHLRQEGRAHLAGKRKPLRLIAGGLAEWHKSTGTLGIEEQLRSATQFGIAQAAPHATLVSATPVTAGCRSIKSPAELALMQLANDATLAVYHAVWKAL